MHVKSFSKNKHQKKLPKFKYHLCNKTIALQNLPRIPPNYMSHNALLFPQCIVPGNVMTGDHVYILINGHHRVPWKHTWQNGLDLIQPKSLHQGSQDKVTEIRSLKGTLCCGTIKYWKEVTHVCNS